MRGAGNRIGDEGALGLAEAVKTNTTLQTLNLEGEWTDVLVGWSGGRCGATSFFCNARTRYRSHQQQIDAA